MSSVSEGLTSGIALGSNLGDRYVNLHRAREAISARFGPARCSAVYETEPVGCDPGAEPFLNAVLEIAYGGQPILLLNALHEIEIAMGRPSRRPRNASRIIDLDVLYVANLTLNNDEIVIPHPRLHLRRFMLAPLCDLQPHLVLPGRTETVAQMLAKLPAEPKVERVADGLHVTK